MKIYLDDIRPAPSGWIHAYTVSELITLYKDNENNIEELSLDHDLGDGLQTGYDFMRWLELEIFESRINNLPKINFHTSNPVGKYRMELVLKAINNVLSRRK